MRIIPAVLGVLFLISASHLEAQTIDITHYATCDGVHDDYASITGLISTLQSSHTSTGGGAMIEIPANVACRTSAPIALPQGFIIIGDNSLTSSISPLTNSMASVFNIIGGYSGVKNLAVRNDSGLATSGIVINKPMDGYPVEISGNSIAFFSYGVRGLKGDAFFVFRNYFVNNSQAAIASTDYGVNSHYNFNYVQGGPGFTFQYVNQGPEGVEIAGNDFVLRSYPCIYIESALEFSIHDNICDQVVGGPGLWINPLRTVFNIKSSNNWYGLFSPTGTGTPSGIFLSAGPVFGANKITSLNDTFYGWTQAAIFSLGTSSINNTNLTIENPIFYYPGSGATQNTRDIQLDYTTGCSVRGAIFTGLASATLDAGSVCRFDQNRWNLPPNGAAVANSQFGRQISGLETVSTGAGTIPSGSTSTTITHGLWLAPLASQVQIMLTNAPTSAPGLPFVTACGATTCTVNVPNSPGSSGMTFAWKVDVAQ